MQRFVPEFFIRRKSHFRQNSGFVLPGQTPSLIARPTGARRGESLLDPSPVSDEPQSAASRPRWRLTISNGDHELARIFPAGAFVPPRTTGRLDL